MALEVLSKITIPWAPLICLQIIFELGSSIFTHRGQEKPPGTIVILPLQGRTGSFHCTYPRTKQSLPGHLKIPSEQLSHLLKVAEGIIFYSVLSPATKKQNSIVDLMWKLSKRQQISFIFQAEKKAQDPPTSISNNQKKPVRGHKHFFSNRTLNSWIFQWVKWRKLLRFAIC